MKVTELHAISFAMCPLLYETDFEKVFKLCLGFMYGQKNVLFNDAFNCWDYIVSTVDE